MDKKLLVFDSHPVQYRVPIWKAIEAAYPGCLHVVYASDCSVRGYQDLEFGRSVIWDDPLLEGYSNSVLLAENGIPLSGWSSLTGKGVKAQFELHKPDAVLLTGFNYKYDLVVCKEALSKRIPIWLRCENQDYAFNRSKAKAFFRMMFYQAVYFQVAKFFYIGEMNKRHYLKHGVSLQKLRAAHYCTMDRFEGMNLSKKLKLRTLARNRASIDQSRLVVGFSGKFIEKKNPEILFKCLEFLPNEIRSRVTFYFIGSGELEETLRLKSEHAFYAYGVPSYFAGFVNQTHLPEHYLAIDVLVLPSRRMGETWGLVANEALQAGCSVIVSDAVGCSVDFEGYERFKTFPEGNLKVLAHAIAELGSFSRDFEWAKGLLTNYSVERVAASLMNELQANGF